ncbi:MAG: triose-phosphate isomerase, partial [Syntrophomonadaceae bacterium]|nr:triose-phosphate isomerase [Syntrophomonadaceae bacterium]
MRRLLIAGNWKMNKSVKEAHDYIHEFRNLNWHDDRDVAILAPFTCLSVFHEAKEWSRVQYGAQNMFWDKEGAFTGEISPLMLLEL